MASRVKIVLLSAFSLLPVLLVIGGCTEANDSSNRSRTESSGIVQNLDGGPEKLLDNPVPSKEPEPYFKEATLTAVGDIMMHLPQIYSGFDTKTRTYHFDSFFTEIKDRLAEGDWVIGNLETTLTNDDPRGYTGYPEFNAPPELADALQAAGFNILTTANNHSLDRRERGVLRTLENVRSKGILPVGTASSADEAAELHIVTHRDISMAILAYTYGTNGIPIPDGKDYLVNLINGQKIIEDINRVKSLKPDLVTVALHFGNEYQPLPTAEQQQLVDSLFRAGADIILGSHPHVLQPYQIVDVTREDGTIRKGIVIYSMGNFISNQDRVRNNKKPTDVGVIFEIDIRKRFPDGEITFTDVRAVPTYVHKRLNAGKWSYRVLQLDEILTTRADELLSAKDYERLDGYYAEAVAHLQSMKSPAEAASAP